jgi:NAD(P)H-flavin reductase
MYKLNEIIETKQFSELVWCYKIYQPLIATKRKAGQFIILRVEPDGERIPLTIASASAEEGWIEIVFQVMGHTTKILSNLNRGDCITDLAGPLGTPTHIENFGRCVCIAGGIGAAPLYPIIHALKEHGNHITSIIGARNKDLIVFEDRITKQSDVTFIATDDGSKGHQGFVSDVFKRLIADGEHFDLAIVIGPPMMMKVTSTLTVAQGIHTVVSLNPLMIDGTGMCGGCRVTIHGKTKFACVDGPEFDASGVDWDEMINRLGTYRNFEEHIKKHQCQVIG